MYVKFMTHESDELGKKALHLLGEMGYKVEVLSGDIIYAPSLSIAVFSDPHPHDVKRWKKRKTVLPVPWLVGEVPVWAEATPFRVTLREHEHESSLVAALTHLSRGYDEWLPSMWPKLPWAASDVKIRKDEESLATEWIEWVRRIEYKEGMEGQTTIRRVQIDAWDVKVSGHEEFFRPALIKQATDALKSWKHLFPYENTWVHRAHGVPSLFVRIDCTVQEDGTLGVYEVEDRPAGMGLVLEAIQPEGFIDRLESLRSAWPSFSSVVSDRRRAHDDSLWLKSETLSEASSGNGLVIVRAEPEETQFHVLQERAVSTVKTKGRKDYGEGMGLWSRVSYRNFNELPWDEGEGFVLKPLQGSKAKDVEIWYRGPRRIVGKKVKGLSTQSRIRNVLRRNDEMNLQPLIMPMWKNVEGLRGCFMAYRMFFGYDISTKQYVPLGGFWNVRVAQLKIHGATDTIFGPLVASQ